MVIITTVKNVNELHWDSTHVVVIDGCHSRDPTIGYQIMEYYKDGMFNLTVLF